MNHRAKITGLYSFKPQRHDVVVSARQTPGTCHVDDVNRFMELTNQIALENSGGQQPAELVEARSHLEDHDELEGLDDIVDAELVDDEAP